MPTVAAAGVPTGSTFKTATGPKPQADQSAWTNPAAAAALRSTIDLLKSSEDGILRNFQDSDRARSFSTDLRAGTDILGVAQAAVSGDASKENDAFLPLLDRAGTSVGMAVNHLDDKNLAQTWPETRMDVVNAIRQARLISENVAKQLDPLNKSR